MVKILYIESILKNNDIKLDESEIKKLPKNIFLAYTLQYKKAAESIKKQLEDKKIRIMGFQQVLGCSKISTEFPLLLVSTGEFHAKNLYLQVPAIYIIAGNKISKISQKEIEQVQRRKKAALLKFLNSENIGILVSTKLGQENLASAIRLRAKLIKKGKKAFIFVSDFIDISQFENFDISSWVNSSCPGLAYDSSSIINIEEASKFL